MRFSTAAALAFVLVRSALATPGVSPNLVTWTLDSGETFKVDKVVTTQEIPPTPDVVLLVDVTFSMEKVIGAIQANLVKVISAVKSAQPTAWLAVASFGDINDLVPFKVNQKLTDDATLLQNAVNSLVAEGGGDLPEDWINALYQLSTGAINYRSDSSRIIVLISDAPSHDPSIGHTLADAITALKGTRVVAVNVGDIDEFGQATAVTKATGGVIVGSSADDVTNAIISGLKKLNVTIKPDIISCDASLTVEFTPSKTTVSSGSAAHFDEKVNIASNAPKDATLKCSVRFLLNGEPGGSAYIQNIVVKTKGVESCFTCDPHPGANRCDGTTSCAPTDFGTQCLCRAGYKADAPDDDQKVHWRLKWAQPGQEYRVAVKPEVVCNTKCDSSHSGPEVCKEVSVADCKVPKGFVEQMPLL